MSRKNKGNAEFYLARNPKLKQGKETHINKVLKEMDECRIEKLLEIGHEVRGSNDRSDTNKIQKDCHDTTK